MTRYEEGFVKRACDRGLDVGQAVALLAVVEEGGMNKQAQLGMALRTLGKAVGGRLAGAGTKALQGLGRSGRVTQALGNFAQRNNAGIRAGLNAAKGQALNSRFMQLLTGRNVKGIEKMFVNGRTGRSGRAALDTLKGWGRTANKELIEGLRGGKGYLDRAGLDALRATRKADFGAMQRALSSGVMPGNAAARDVLRRAYNTEAGKVLATRIGTGAAGLGVLGLGSRALTRDERY